MLVVSAVLEIVFLNIFESKKQLNIDRDIFKRNTDILRLETCNKFLKNLLQLTKNLRGFSMKSMSALNFWKDWFEKNKAGIEEYHENQKKRKRGSFTVVCWGKKYQENIYDDFSKTIEKYTKKIRPSNKNSCVWIQYTNSQDETIVMETFIENNKVNKM